VWRIVVALAFNTGQIPANGIFRFFPEAAIHAETHFLGGGFHYRPPFQAPHQSLAAVTGYGWSPRRGGSLRHSPEGLVVLAWSTGAQNPQVEQIF